MEEVTKCRSTQLNNYNQREATKLPPSRQAPPLGNSIALTLPLGLAGSPVVHQCTQPSGAKGCCLLLSRLGSSSPSNLIPQAGYTAAQMNRHRRCQRHSPHMAGSWDGPFWTWCRFSFTCFPSPRGTSHRDSRLCAPVASDPRAGLFRKQAAREKCFPGEPPCRTLNFLLKSNCKQLHLCSFFLR